MAYSSAAYVRVKVTLDLCSSHKGRPNLLAIINARRASSVNMEADPLPKKSIDVADVESTTNGDHTIVAETARVLDHEAEKKLCRKFDTRILPFLSVMCKFSSSTTRVLINEAKAS